MTSTGRSGVVFEGLPTADRCPRKHKIDDLRREKDRTHLSRAIVVL